jgi:hypothetical protein
LPREALPPARAILDQLTGSFPVLFVIVGLGVLFLRLEDLNAWLLALLFGGFIAAAPLLNVEAGMPPALRGFGVAYKVTFLGLMAPLFYYFFAVFPTSSPIDRRLPWLKQLLLGLAVVVSVPLGLWVLSAGSFQPLLELEDRVFEAGFGSLFNGFIFGTLGLGFVSLLWNTRATCAGRRGSSSSGRLSVWARSRCCKQQAPTSIKRLLRSSRSGSGHLASSPPF